MWRADRRELDHAASPAGDSAGLRTGTGVPGSSRWLRASTGRGGQSRWLVRPWSVPPARHTGWRRAVENGESRTGPAGKTWWLARFSPRPPAASDAGAAVAAPPVWHFLQPSPVARSRAQAASATESTRTWGRTNFTWPSLGKTWLELRMRSRPSQWLMRSCRSTTASGGRHSRQNDRMVLAEGWVVSVVCVFFE